MCFTSEEGDSGEPPFFSYGDPLFLLPPSHMHAAWEFACLFADASKKITLQHNG